MKEMLKRDPPCGHLFMFRGQRENQIKMLWHDRQRISRLAKRPERERYVWQRIEGESVTITANAAVRNVEI